MKSMELKAAIMATTAATGLCLSGIAIAQPKAETYQVELTELNNSGVKGKVNLRLLKDRYLQVTINATGLEMDGLHVGHIHGTLDAAGNPTDAMCPTLEDDADGDGFIELGEGVPQYGPIIIPLGPPPLGEDLDPDGDGTIEYEMTFDLMDGAIFGDGFDKDAVFPLSFREIVLHGLTVAPGPGAGTDGEVNGTNGYLAVLPVACGGIEVKGQGNRQGPKSVNF